MSDFKINDLNDLLSGLKNGDFMKNMQENVTKMQEKLKERTYKAKSGGNMVEVTINGAFELVDLNIDDKLLSDKKTLEIFLMSAFNDAIKMALNDKTSALNPFGGEFSNSGFSK